MKPMFELPVEDFCPETLALLGVPTDENSSYLRGAAGGPSHLRRALYSGSANLCAENGFDLGTDGRFRDAGDLTLPAGDGGFEQIEAAAAHLLRAGARLLSLGGDHSITFPLVKACAEKYGPLTVVDFDAHPDLYDEYDGNRLSHACPFARIMEAGLAARLVQVGIRTVNPQQRRQAERFGVELIEMRALAPLRLGDSGGPLYVSLDLDVLEPGLAPGVSHHEPGGLSPRQVIEMIQHLPAAPVAADIVELNPTRDLHDITAMVGAKFIKELAAKMLAA